MAAFVARQVVKNEQQSEKLLLEVDQRSTFRNNFLQPATNVFVAGQVDGARWKTGNIDKNLHRNNVARQVEGLCISYLVAFRASLKGPRTQQRSNSQSKFADR